jgi:PD-(D/E)XK nuclease superfamily
MRVFPTSLTQWQRCEKSWDFRYRRRLRYQSVWSVKGGAIHEALATYYRLRLDTGAVMDAEAVVEVFRESVRFRQSSVGQEQHGAMLWWGDESPSQILEDGEAQLRFYLRTVAPEITPVAVEERFAADFPGDLSLTGIIDLVDDELRIRESKFPQVTPAGDALLGEWQPIIYSALWQAATGEWPRAFVLDVVTRGRAKRPRPTLARIEVPISEALVRSRLDDLAFTVATMEVAWQTGVYPRRPSMIACGRCVYKVPCWDGTGMPLASRPSLEPATTPSPTPASSSPPTTPPLPPPTFTPSPPSSTTAAPTPATPPTPTTTMSPSPTPASPSTSTPASPSC